MDLEQVRARGLEFVSASSGRLLNFALKFNKVNTLVTGGGHANIEIEDDALVEGVLFLLKDERAIEIMDPFEGVPLRYRRISVLVQCEGGPHNAWTYIAQPQFVSERLQPTRTYLQRLLNGRPFLSQDYWHWLAQHSVIDEGVVNRG